jgi:hypothetical protein
MGPMQGVVGQGISRVGELRLVATALERGGPRRARGGERHRRGNPLGTLLSPLRVVASPASHPLRGHPLCQADRGRTLRCSSVQATLLEPV